MNELLLFSDGSVNTKTKVGFGAYLTVSNYNIPLAELKKQVKIKQFENTSSTKLELQTLLWALNENLDIGQNIVIHTDSQNIISLTARRAGLEKNDYWSKNNKRINNYEEYKEFYRLTDRLTCKLIKVTGHKASENKDYIDRLFSIVDKASRHALRNDNENQILH